MKRKVVLNADEIHDAIFDYVISHRIFGEIDRKQLESQFVYDEGGCTWSQEIEVTVVPENEDEPQTN